MLVNQWSMIGRVLDLSLVLYFSFEADIHNIECHDIFLVWKFYLRIWQNVKIGFLLWRGLVLLELYIPYESKLYSG